jgi:hypothetical protein
VAFIKYFMFGGMKNSEARHFEKNKKTWFNNHEKKPFR